MAGHPFPGYCGLIRLKTFNTAASHKHSYLRILTLDRAASFPAPPLLRARTLFARQLNEVSVCLGRYLNCTARI